MKYLSLFAVVMFAVAAQAQTTSATAGALSKVSAELSKPIESRNAHVGDAVDVKTMVAVTLADGTQLPKGTKLAGKVTEVRAKSNADKTSHLAFSLDRAILRDGHEVPIHAMLGALSVPSVATPAAVNDFGTGNSGTARGAGESLPAANQMAGITPSMDPTAGKGRTAAGMNPNTSTVQPVSVAPPAAATTTTTATAGAGAAITGPHIDHAAVMHLPGVTFSSTLNGTDTASLDATGQNIMVDGGSLMVLILRVGQK